MSHYAVAEQALLALGRTYAKDGVTFGEKNSSRNDYRVRDANGTRYSFVLTQHRASQFGFSLRNRAAQGKRQEVHYIRLTAMIERAQGDTGDGVAFNLLTDLVVGLIDFLTKYPRLNNTDGVKQALVIESGPPALSGRNGERATHVVCDIILEVFCETPYNPLEAGQ